MAHRYINPPTLARPMGYTHVVEASGARTFYISGQVALDDSGNIVGEGDMGAQARQVFENLHTALRSVGESFKDVVKLTYFVVDMSQMQTVREVRNLRATGRATIATRGRTEEVTATELDPTERLAYFRDVLTPFARSIPFGVLFIRIADGVDLNDPVAAADGRRVFELRPVR